MSIEILKKITKIFPTLSAKSTKGNNGRIAVIGGSY
jgi:NAD(P)H-hydrate repair Nnr-like enzyme with NAD(P)H-hydrate dehydratase domain